MIGCVWLGMASESVQCTGDQCSAVGSEVWHPCHAAVAMCDACCQYGCGGDGG